MNDEVMCACDRKARNKPPIAPGVPSHLRPDVTEKEAPLPITTTRTPTLLPRRPCLPLLLPLHLPRAEGGGRLRERLAAMVVQKVVLLHTAAWLLVIVMMMVVVGS